MRILSFFFFFFFSIKLNTRYFNNNFYLRFCFKFSATIQSNPFRSLLLFLPPPPPPLFFSTTDFNPPPHVSHLNTPPLLYFPSVFLFSSSPPFTHSLATLRSGFVQFLLFFLSLFLFPTHVHEPEFVAGFLFFFLRLRWVCWEMSRVCNFFYVYKLWFWNWFHFVARILFCGLRYKFFHCCWLWFYVQWFFCCSQDRRRLGMANENFSGSHQLYRIENLYMVAQLILSIR